MSTQVQYRRGSNVQVAAFTGALGELVIDTTNKIVVVNDGATAGGFPGVGLTATQTITNKIYQGTSVSVTGNIDGGNIRTGGTISATGNISGGNIIGTIVGTISTTSASVSGNITGGNLLTGGLISATGNIVTGTNGALGIGTSQPDCEVNILANPQTVSYTVGGNSTTSGTDLHISGADSAQTRITQDSFGASAYVAFTGRTARGTAGSPAQTLSGDTLTQFTARGFSGGSLQFGNSSTGRVDIVAAENFTDSSRATNVVVYTTASGAITPTAIATFSSASGLSVAGNITGANINGIINTNSILNSGANGSGNIGSSTTYFNTIFAKATSAQYADLAEMYCADADYAPGTLVEFGGTSEVTATTESHSTRVAGIISTNPSYLMNSTIACEINAVAVALTGRVPCRVVGAIGKGDRLVASGLHAGVATVLDMSQYQPGCIIGKALENYNSTEVGTIEVAVGRT